MIIRDRIIELRRVNAADLRPNPRNWRTHPPAQQDAMRGVLAEIGYAGALLARRLPDGGLELIDGHLRAELTPDAEVPVLVLDLEKSEADTLLAVFDPLSAMAATDAETLAGLLDGVETESDAVRAMLDGMLKAGDGALPASEGNIDEMPSSSNDLDVPEAYQVVVECRDEEQQRSVYERLTAEGFACKLLTL